MLHDGDCPFCRAEVRLLAKLNRQGRLRLIDIARPEFDPGAYGLSKEALMGEIHGVLPDGQIVVGMEVFRQAYKAVGLGWLLAPTGWPLLRVVFDGLYVLFARYRVRLGNLVGRGCAGGTCGVRASKRD